MRRTQRVRWVRHRTKEDTEGEMFEEDEEDEVKVALQMITLNPVSKWSKTVKTCSELFPRPPATRCSFLHPPALSPGRPLAKMDLFSRKMTVVLTVLG